MTARQAGRRWSLGQADQSTVFGLSAKAVEDGVPTGRTDTVELALTEPPGMVRQ
jgi:hypothetical protein